jgi:hypothetical protein
VVLATVVGAMLPATAHAASAHAVALPPSIPAAASLLSCSANPLRIAEAGKPMPGMTQTCKNDQVAGAQSTGKAGAVAVTATGVAGATSVSTGAVTVQAATGSTEAGVTMTTISGQATAAASAAHLVVGKTTIDLGMLTTKSTITCTYGPSGATFSYRSTSSVGSLKINGKRMAIGNGTRSIRIPAGTLMLNHSSKTATGITQHAAMLHTTGADVTLGEAAVAIANTPRNPCYPPPA